MTRARRKKLCKKQYNIKKQEKVLAIVKCKIRLAMAAAITPDIYDYIEPIIRAQELAIIHQPIRKYNKYGYFSYISKYTIGVNVSCDMSKARESIDKIIHSDNNAFITLYGKPLTEGPILPSISINNNKGGNNEIKN